jgi:hypothetical protein
MPCRHHQVLLVPQQRFIQQQQDHQGLGMWAPEFPVPQHQRPQLVLLILAILSAATCLLANAVSAKLYCFTHHRTLIRHAWHPADSLQTLALLAP